MKKIFYVLIAGSLLMTGCKAKKNYQSWDSVYDPATPAETTVTPVQTSVPATPAATNVRVQSEAVTVTHGSAEKYCIIVGSFSNVDNAARLMNDLKNRNYGGCCIMKNASNMNRVCCASYATESEARQKLAEVRGEFADAWLLIRQ